MLVIPSDDLLIKFVPFCDTQVSLREYIGVALPDLPKLTVPSEVCLIHICPPRSE